jgi:Tfp pilus assembly protein PilW
MKRHAQELGFSLVELMVALLSGSVLALTAGSMMYYTYLGWERSNRAVGIQRDAAMASELLSHSLRRTAAVNVTVSASTITIVRSSVTEQFSVNGQNLVYDPDTATPGDEETIISGRVASFVPTGYTEGLSFVLVLTDGTESTRIDKVVTYRNET